MPTHATPQIAQTVGRNIRTARTAVGLSQHELAQRIGGKVTSRDVSRWERGGVEPTKYRHLLAEILFGGDLGAMYDEQEAAAA